MEDIVSIIAIYIGVVVLVAVMFLAYRSFTNATTPITLYTPKSGITCALATTADGVALSCWKD